MNNKNEKSPSMQRYDSFYTKNLSYKMEKNDAWQNANL